MATVRLTDLLPTNGYLLPYVLSLFFASLVLTFAGAFLILDRTRSFPPAGDAFQDRQKSTSRFVTSFVRGGVGSILTGFVFGIHFTTFLALLLPSVTSSEPLKPSPYVSICLLTSLITSIAAGRWRYFGFVTSGFCGGTAIALAVSVIIHPSLITRIALVSVFAPTLAVLTPLPITRLQPILLRTSTSAVGSFGLVLSIALFSHVEPWSNIWERLWVHDDIRWGSVQEKGLSAGFFLFLASGIGTDWWLKFKFGENPDQKWDSYLAQYVANLPAESDRAGIFHPFTSMWSKPPFIEPALGPSAPSEASWEKHINLLRKGGRNKWTGHGDNFNAKTRGDIKFRPLDNDDDSTDSDTGEGHIFKGDTNLHPCVAGTGSTHSSTPTVLEGVHSHVIGGKDSYQIISPAPFSTGIEGSGLLDYSDHEVDITSDVKSVRHGPGWTPRFLQTKAQLPKPQPDDRHTSQVLSDAGRQNPSQKDLRELSKNHESPRWQAFWRDVNEKIQHKEIS